MTEQQKVEELLIPRYKVTADFWHNPFKVGEVLELCEKEPGVWCYKLHMCVTNSEPEIPTYIPEAAFSGFPHLFQLMPWWQDRKAEMMPKYAKPNPHGMLPNFRGQDWVKEIKWEFNPAGWWWVYDLAFAVHATHLLPATPEEFETFMSANEHEA